MVNSTQVAVEICLEMVVFQVCVSTHVFAGVCIQVCFQVCVPKLMFPGVYFHSCLLQVCVFTVAMCLVLYAVCFLVNV